MTEKVQNRLSFIINVVFVAVVVALVYLALKYAVGWVLPFVLAFCIVSAINPLIRVIKKNLKIKQEIVSLIVMALIYALLAVLLFLLLMQLFLLAKDGITALPEHFEQSILPALQRAGDSVMGFIRDLPPEWQEIVTNVQDGITGGLQSLMLNLSTWGVGAISRLTTGIPSFLIAFAFTIMLSFFISMQYDKVVEFFRVQFSDKVELVMGQLKAIVIDTIFKYLRATATLMFITCIELSIGLLAIRTANAIPIALGIALFDALPFFGTGAVMIPWVAIELLQGNYTYAVALGILYAIVTVVRNIIEPKIVGDKLGLNPIVSLTAIYVGFKVFGVLGMIVMPIITQIAMELHRGGTIRLFKERIEETGKHNAEETPS